MATNKTLINDMTQGSVFRQLIRFSLPMMLANVLQVGFNLVDMFFVGKFISTDALSAVTIASQITQLMFFVFLGVSVAGQIYVAQMVGAGKGKGLNEVIGNIVTLSVLAGGVLMLVIPLAQPVLRLINTPESVMEEAVVYLCVLSYVNILVSLYNGLCGILRGFGDSTRPTVFVAVATVVNIVLDYVFIAIFHWGVAGAAWATLIGQSSACVFALVYLFRKREAFGFDFKLSSLIPRRKYMTALLRIGVPVTMKGLCINLSMLFVNAQINALGVLAVAVTGVSHKVQNLMLVMGNAMNDATSAIVGQNMGAGKLDRVKRTVWCAFAVGMAYMLLLVVLFLLFPEEIFSLFTNDQAVIALAAPFMAVAALTAVSFGGMAPFLGLLTGVGATGLNMVIAVADGVVGRLTLSILFGYGLNMGALGFVLGNACAGYISFFWAGGYFFSGRWRKRSTVLAPEDENG